MDRRVVVRRAGPVAFRAGPGRTLHGAGRQVDQFSVQGVRAGVLDLHRVHAAGEVPGSHSGDGGGLDLAVEAAHRRTVARLLGANHHRAGRFQRQRQRRHRLGLALVVDGMCPPQRLLADAYRARPGIGAGPHAIPDARPQALADHGSRTAHLQRHTLRRQHERKAGAALGIAARQDRLRPIVWKRRPDRRLDREIGRQLQAGRSLDQTVGTGPGVLHARGEASVEEFRQVLQLRRRAAGVGVAADDPHQRGVVGVGSGARDLKGDFFSDPNGDFVGVAGERCGHV